MLASFCFHRSFAGWIILWILNPRWLKGAFTRYALNMLKKDLIKKKSITAILFDFVFLSAFSQR